nr:MULTISPECIES: NACHT domain-containing protein [unclassified Streptomyces]
MAAALAATLHALGDVTLTDLEAVRLGPEAFARQLRAAAPYLGLGQDAELFYGGLLELTCLHMLNFFTQRSTFIPATLVEQSRLHAETIAKIDALLTRIPRQDGRDAAFERTYLDYIAQRHSTLTIFGLDLAPGSARWPLDVAYISLEAASLRHGFTAGPADEVLTRNERALLRGEAGSGKTTLIQWLAVSAARGEQGGRIPYVLPLRTLTRHGERLPAPRDFLAAVGSPLAGEQPEGWEGRVLREGRALMLVDGLDEIPKAERSLARAWLTDLLAAYPGNRWLVTSRPSAVRQNWLTGEDFEELTLSPMNRAEVAGFIERWHAAAGGDDGARDELLASVRTKPDLGRLATNPLLCGMICALHRERRGFLPSGRKELYTAALSMLLYRRDKERDMRLPELAEEPQLQLLQRLAYWLIRNARTELEQAQAEALVAKALPSVPTAQVLGEAPAVLRHFLERTGLLRAPTEDTLEFVHRTFQDFLGARAALDEGSFGELAGNAEDDQWEDVIRMAVAQGRPREREELIRDLLARGSNRGVLLALASLEYAAELDPGLRDAVETAAGRLIPPTSADAASELARVGPLVLELLPGPGELGSDTDPMYVLTTAAQVNSDRAIPFLARYCRHPSPAVRSLLGSLWVLFDPRQYAEEVIAHIDPPPEPLAVSSDARLEALGDFAPQRLVHATGGLSYEALAGYLRQVQVEELSLNELATLADVGLLRGQNALRTLFISQCTELQDLRGLTGLPVERAGLTLARRLPVGAVTRSWRHLRALTLRGHYDWSLDDLDPGVSLHELRLGQAPPSLDGLSSHRELRELSLGHAPSLADWEAIGHLKRLELLTLPASALDVIPRSLYMPSVLSLDLTAPDGSAVRAHPWRLANHFPNANQL